MGEVLTFRFDDISVNSNMSEVNDIAFYLKTRFPECRIIYGISPLVEDMSNYPDENQQRVFPKNLSALSDHRHFFATNKMGVPETPDYIIRASHGLFHADSRLLSRECQEMSILGSCSLVNANIFIPPFNKWNKDTEEVCNFYGIELIKFELGWLSAEHNQFSAEHKLWYFHHWAFGLYKVKNWLDGK